MTTFAQRLRQARKERGMKVGELAERCNMAFSAFKEYECGRRLPRLDKFVVIAEVLDCSLDFLAGLEEA
jgi:transcriptional regulator with XRE-family HTH domain